MVFLNITLSCSSPERFFAMMVCILTKFSRHFCSFSWIRWHLFVLEMMLSISTTSTHNSCSAILHASQHGSSCDRQKYSIVWSGWYSHSTLFVVIFNLIMSFLFDTVFDSWKWKKRPRIDVLHFLLHIGTDHVASIYFHPSQKFIFRAIRFQILPISLWKLP